MGLFSLLQYALFLLVVAVLVKPVGGYLARVFNREKTFLDPILRPLERLIYKLARVDPEQEMDWKRYAISFVYFSLVGTLLLYGILRLQHLLPGVFPVLSHNAAYARPGDKHRRQLFDYDHLAGLCG